MKLELPNVINFVKLLNKFRDIERVIHSNGGDRRENDVEHSYQLAMLAWYIISTKKLNLNLDLIIKYSLVHDLVEVYAGDTYIYTKDKFLKNNKEKREKESLIKMKQEFSEFPEIFNLIEEYEKKDLDEAKFVYALDKIEPILNIYTNGGRTWKEKNITIEMLIENKKDKIKLFPEFEEFFDDIIEMINKEKEFLF
jgi:putative hydrolase of HD superfamily